LLKGLWVGHHLLLSTVAVVGVAERLVQDLALMVLHKLVALAVAELHHQSREVQ
jgi:hypothetical protein